MCLENSEGIKKEPLVSIIIPTYNRSKLLKRAVESVLNQTYQNFEIIIVDDGSTDNTDEIVGSLKKVSKRLTYIKNKQNIGAAAARNVGIKHARGDLIAFQDSDDVWLPDKLKKQIEALSKYPNVDVVYTGEIIIKDGIKTYAPIFKPQRNIHETLLMKNVVDTPTMIVKRECLENFGLFDEALPRLQDWELVIRLSTHCTFYFIDEPLVISFIQSDGISSDRRLDTLVDAQEKILRKHFYEFSKDKKILAKYYFDLGITYYLMSNFDVGKEYFLRALSLNKSFKIAFMYLLSFNNSLFFIFIKFYKVYKYLSNKIRHFNKISIIRWQLNEL